jgi:hypothetical protein
VRGVSTGKDMNSESRRTVRGQYKERRLKGDFRRSGGMRNSIIIIDRTGTVRGR